MPVFYLAFRNYCRHYNRYAVILLSLTAVIGLSAVVLGLASGMRDSISEKARRYFAGDIVVQAFELKDTSRLEIEDKAVLDGFAENRENLVQLVVKRSLYLQPSQLFFNGKYIVQRRVTGVDWEAEKDVLSSLSLREGTFPEKNDKNAILVSTVVADFLGLAIGDRVVLTGLITATQRNTHNFVVRGIFNEGSFFAYASYVYRESLNEFTNRPADYIDEAGLYLKDHGNKSRRGALALELRDELSQHYSVVPVLKSRADRDMYIRSSEQEGTVLAVLTLDAQLAEITELLDALLLITFIVLFVFAVLISIGISNTFSMVVIERRVEIGTLRSLGMFQKQVITLFLAESIFLALNAILYGLLCAILVLTWFGASPILNSSIPALILNNGRIPWILAPGAVLAIAILSIATCIFGTFRIVHKTSRITPLEALNQQ